MKIIAKYEGGSKSYGLSTPESDVDIRFLFIHDEISKIIGLERHDHENKMSDGDDIQGFELRHFLNLLKRGNTQCLEMLFNDIWLEKSEYFDLIAENRNRLLDSKTIFTCLSGYAFSERKLIFGTAHLGKIGEKRRKTIEDYGYSYRNAVHAFRLIRAGIMFFETGVFPVNIVEKDKEYGSFIKDLKTNPSKFKPETLDLQLQELDEELKKSFDNRKITYSFDNGFANELCFKLYLPIITLYGINILEKKDL